MNYKIKHIKSLIIDDKIETDPIRIMQGEKDFYEKLYSDGNCSNDGIEQYLQNVDGPKLSEQSKELCENQISEEEIKKAVSDMQNNKSPGPDGIPIEFYKIFWNDIKDVLIENYFLTKKQNFTKRSEKRNYKFDTKRR